MLFSAYRKDEFSDPESYLAQLGIVLEGFADEVIVAVTHPRTGLQRRLKWPPTIAEVVEACEAEARRIDTTARYGRMQRRSYPALADYSIPQPGRRANLLVRSEAPQYGVACEWAATAGEADWKTDPEGRGIWVNWLASPLAHVRSEGVK